MGFYGDRVVPRFIDLVMSRGELTPIRARVAASLDGDVLEVGFGSGLNVPHYPSAVNHVQAVDPATVGRKLAAKRVASSGVPVEYVDLDGQALSLASASVDHVLTTWTLCSIPDVDRALSEIRRVLRPGGLFHFVWTQTAIRTDAADGARPRTRTRGAFTRPEAAVPTKTPTAMAGNAWPGLTRPSQRDPPPNLPRPKAPLGALCGVVSHSTRPMLRLTRPGHPNAFRRSLSRARCANDSRATR
jgi:SAM-dependent methyltransferase